LATIDWIIIVVSITEGKLDDFVVFSLIIAGNLTSKGTIAEKNPRFKDSWKNISDIS
jgi:hypothetical protein